MRDSGVPAVEMAFMMPVVKNEWDIYKTNRTRRSILRVLQSPGLSQQKGECVL